MDDLHQKNVVSMNRDKVRRTMGEQQAPDEANALDRLLTEKQVYPHLIPVSISQGQQWRVRGEGPRWCKIGRLVRYRLSDVLQFIKDLPTL